MRAAWGRVLRCGVLEEELEVNQAWGSRECEHKSGQTLMWHLIDARNL